MRELKKEELIIINGGLSISGSLINALVKGINAFLDLGRSLGTAFRRIGSLSLCPL